MLPASSQPRGPRASGSSARFRRSVLWLGFALPLQAAVVLLVVPVAAAQRPVLSAEALSFGQVITATLSSPANGPVGGIWTPQYRIELDPRNDVDDAVIVGRPGNGLELLDVQTSQGTIDFGGTVYTITARAPFDAPIVFTSSLAILEQGVHTQAVKVGFPRQQPVVVTDTLVAQEPPLTFNIHRVYPGLLRLAEPYTDVYRVAPAGRRVITDTIVAGALARGVYESVLTNHGQCGIAISTFTCVMGVLGPSFPSAHITITALALDLGITDRFVRVSGGGDSIVVTSTTIVQAPVRFDVMIDVTPGDDDNPINIKSQGSIPVAILSTAGFSAVDEIKPDSIAFGRTGTERSLIACQAEDSNRDGLADLVCHFATQATGFQPGDTEAVLTAETFSGVPIRGVATIRIVPAPGRQ